MQTYTKNHGKNEKKKKATCPSAYILLLLKGMKIFINNLNFNKDFKKREREKKKYGFQKCLNPIRSQI